MLRLATPEDVTAILALVRELAEYEGAADAAQAGADDLHRALFAANPQAFAHIVEQDGDVVATAVWYVTFSTWTGQHGIHLVDLIVGARARGAGHGRSLVTELAAICVERGYRRLDWEVLDALEHAEPPGPQGFYRRLGGTPRHGWTGWRLDGDVLQQLGTRQDH